jgi:hypothetical protein
MVWLTMFSVSSFVLARLLAGRRPAAEADTARRTAKVVIARSTIRQLTTAMKADIWF